MKKEYFSAWRRTSIVALVLLALVAATASLYSVQHTLAQAGTRTPLVRHGTIPAAPGHATLTYQRTVTFGQFAHTQPSNQVKSFSQLPAKWRGTMSASQQAAYQRNVTHLPGLARVSAQPQVLPQAGPSATVPATPTPNFDACGYKDIPCKTYGFVGSLDSNDLPAYSIASNPSYVLASDGSLITAYTFSGSVVTGPIYTGTFFNLISDQNVVYYISPAGLAWDATRGHWVIAISVVAAYDVGFNAYQEMAVSMGDTPNLNAATQWNLFTVTYGGSTDYCIEPPSITFPAQGFQVGMDYWGLWLTCTVYAYIGNSYVNNAVLVVNKNQLYTGQSGNVFAFLGIPSGISCGSGCLKSALNFVPALEDGTPDAEFLLATDAGFGGPFSDLVTVAFTNTHAIVHNLPPTASYVITTLPQPYADPMNASQPGQNGTLYISPGISQVQYKGGDLLTAWTTPAVFSGVTHDGAYWLDETPQLTPLNPSNPGTQQAATPILRNAGIYGFSKSDAYKPVLIASSELDETLVMTDSSDTVTIYPSMLYTGRRATDAPNEMGVNVAYSFAIGGTTTLSTFWNSVYSYWNACSLDTNLTSRGLVWCMGQYGAPGSNANDYYVAGLSNE